MKGRILIASAAVAVAALAGPRTTPEAFLTKHLDVSVPALSSIPAKMSADGGVFEWEKPDAVPPPAF